MGVWGVVIFVLSVMRVVGGVPLWVVSCVSSCRCYVFVSVVHPVVNLSAVFCVICSLLILCLMLLLTIWWKRTRVWVLLWLCMFRGSFPFVPPMLLM